ncbi:MAG: VapE domain-containing protein, partial [Hyphomonadaceae bacterium]
MPEGWANPSVWAIDEQNKIWATITNEWPAALPVPTTRLFSGGGFQLIWELAAPYDGDDKRELFERMAGFAQSSMEAMGLRPDATHNIDRLCRLNKTTNRPKAAKQAKGQTDSVATLIGSPHRKYSIEELRSAFDKPIAKPGAGQPLEAVKVTDEDLAAWGCDEALLSIIRDGFSHFSFKLKDNSRSAWEWDAACRLLRLRLEDAQIAGVFLNPAWKIGERARERRVPLAHIARLIERARHVTGAAAREFISGDDGRPKRCRANYIAAIHKLGLRLTYNEFSDDLSIGGVDGVGPLLDEKATTRVRFMIEDRFGFLPDKELIGDVLADEAVQNRFNPVVDHLETLPWDGVARLDRWLVHYCAAEDSPYVREVGRVFLIAAVRRAKHPGTKFDSMLILEGEQGAFKSTAVRVLAGRDDWFSDDVPIGEEGKRVIEATRGKWILEEGELAGMSNRDVEHLKAFCSRVADRGRLAFERRPLDIPRAFVIVGTTNKKSYLSDMTGARRFLPVAVGNIDINALIRDRDQLLAEAVVREAAGESIVLADAVKEAAEAKREARTVEDGWLDALAPLAERDEIFSAECWAALDIPSRERDQRKTQRLADCLAALGFERAEAQHNTRGRRGVRWVRSAPKG